MGTNIWTGMGDTAKRHLKAICSGEVQKTNVIGIRKALNHHWRIASGWSGNRCNVTADEASAIESALERDQPKVTGELHDSGVKLLTSPRYRKRLEHVADIIANLDCFRLIGYEDIGRGHHVPVYRVIAKDGRKFKFRNVPWQSGGDGPEVLS